MRLSPKQVDKLYENRLNAALKKPAIAITFKRSGLLHFVAKDFIALDKPECLVRIHNKSFARHEFPLLLAPGDTLAVVVNVVGSQIQVHGDVEALEAFP